MRDKCHRLLELLQKRGPDAFPKFCAILREDYAWLVEKLEQTYQEKLTAEESEMGKVFFLFHLNILTLQGIKIIFHFKDKL